MGRDKRSSIVIYIAAVTLLLVAAAAHADDPQKPITIHGFVDAYYAWNGSDPASHDNFEPGTGTTAKRANELSLNLAAVEIVRDPAPVGFHLSLVAGNGADVVHAGEPEGFRHIYQASIIYKLNDKLTLEGGIFPSHIGFEGFFSKDNWSYTRGWLGEFSPYYQAGIHASEQFSQHWSGEIHLLNGWQLIRDNNGAKAIGVKIAYSSDRLNASLNTFDGPELPNDNSHWRHFGDLIATFKATKPLSISISVDRGYQALPGSASANWLGIGGFGRYTLDPRRAIAVRIERFNDPEDGISGAPQKLTEATLTYEHRPVKNLILKVEGRRDHSTASVFTSGRNGVSRNESIVVIGAVATF
ncbi:MAG TPA: outer membrane beta-barrel protein [Thermoanaerobaculia bacterium]|nr:outer membrane beta-barrel protein [Thermoanaerobaculia bacterium]